MRKFLAIVFLAIFSFQVVPFKVLGKLLSSGQNVEEVQWDADGDVDAKVIKAGDDQIIYDYSFDQTANRIGFNQKITSFIHRAELLPSVHVAAMPYPPPDSQS